MAKSPSRFNLSGGDSLNSLGSHGGEVADPMIEAFRVIRMEAVRAGFAYCYRNRDYRTIIAVARRILKVFFRKTRSSSCGTTRR